MPCAGHICISMYLSVFSAFIYFVQPVATAWSVSVLSQLFFFFFCVFTMDVQNLVWENIIFLNIFYFLCTLYCCVFVVTLLSYVVDSVQYYFVSTKPDFVVN